MQAEDVRRPLVEPAELIKFENALFAEPVYIHGRSADEMDESLHLLCRTD